MKGIHVGSIDNVATAIEPLQVGEEVLGVVIKERFQKVTNLRRNESPKAVPLLNMIPISV